MEKGNIILMDNVVVQKVGLDSTDMDGEIVMMDMDRGKYYCFNDVGSRIWKLIENPCAVRKLIELLGAEYDVNNETCEESVLEFINMINDEELITVV